MKTKMTKKLKKNNNKKLLILTKVMPIAICPKCLNNLTNKLGVVLEAKG